MKPGYKTTEFWLSLLAFVLGALLTSGAFEAGGLAAKIIGGAMSILAALGYTASRTSTKNSENLKEATNKLIEAKKNENP